MSQVRKLLTGYLPVFLYCFVGLGLMVQGVRYLSASQLMPYHSAVIETPWNSLGADYQILFLGLLKGFGAGSFCVGLVITVLAFIGFRTSSAWTRWVIPVIGATYTGALVYVTSFALLPGATPITVTTTLLLLVMVAAVSSYFGDTGSE
jgi:hypothetical protein